MQPNSRNRFSGVCDPCLDRSILPEAKLWTAVILQAIDDLDRRTSFSPTSAKDSAREWFASESDEVGSFMWTCHIIDVDPSFIRSRLAKKHRMENPVEVVRTSTAQRVKISRENGFPILEARSIASKRPQSRFQKSSSTTLKRAVGAEN
jgi:hypothetical protein